MRRRLPFTLMTLLLIPNLAACVAEEEVPRRTDRPECPHDADTLPLGAPTLSPEIIDVPEFHDCQKFLLPTDAGTGLVYGELFAIFAAWQLAAAPESLARLEGTLPGPVPTERDTVQLAPGGERIVLIPPGTGTAALSFAEVYAEGAYPPLGIMERGFWCLVMYRVGLQWRAKMVNRETVPQQTCRQNFHPDSVQGKELEVRVDLATLQNPLYPEVARWDWDAENKEHYIGIRCTAWCEVGDRGFVSSAQYAVLNLPADVHSQRRIKGWYDEQILAELPSAGTTVEPTRVVGTIFPHHQLALQTTTQHFRQRWVPVAYVALSDSHSGYLAEFNYASLPPPGPHLSEVSICHGTWETCLSAVGRGADQPEEEQPVCKSPDNTGDWWALIRNPRSEHPVFRCVTYRPFPREAQGTPIPAVVRWRWKAVDEGGWARCAEGCCEVE